MIKDYLKGALKSRLSEEQAKQLSDYRNRLRSPVWWGNLRKLKPVDDCWGFRRGLPIDRYYINAFMKRNQNHIQGRVLEIAEPWYIDLFGEGKVTQADILHVASAEPPATMMGNLETGEGILENTYDCVIVTQTIQFIFNIRDGIENIKSSLKPGGVALISAPGISRRDPEALGSYGEYWHYTNDSLERLFGEAFGHDQVQVESFGNVLAAVAFLEGMSTKDLRPKELEFQDPLYSIVHSVKAVKQ